MYCRRCGKEIDDNVAICPHCGARTDDAKETDGSGLAGLLRIDVLVVAAIVILVPLCLYLFTGRKKGPDDNNGSPGSQVTEAGQSDEEGVDPQPDENPQPDANEAAQSEPEPAEEEIVSKAPDYAMAYNGHHYYIYDDGEISFSEAAQKCEDLGGHLAKIDDEDENEELYFYMLDMGFAEAFFGLVYEEGTGKWINYDGSEAVYYDWGTNSAGIKEPNNSGGEEYNVQLDANMSDGHWNDAKFGAKVYTPEGDSYKDRYTYICEWDY